MRRISLALLAGALIVFVNLSFRNTGTHSDAFGITVSQVAHANKFFNNLINGASPVWLHPFGQVQVWNTAKTAGANIGGGSSLGANAWLNPAGTGFSQTWTETDGDGICNTHLVLTASNIDFPPLAILVTPGQAIQNQIYLLQSLVDGFPYGDLKVSATTFNFATNEHEFAQILEGQIFARINSCLQSGFHAGLENPPYLCSQDRCIKSSLGFLFPFLANCARNNAPFQKGEKQYGDLKVAATFSYFRDTPKPNPQVFSASRYSSLQPQFS